MAPLIGKVIDGETALLNRKSLDGTEFFDERRAIIKGYNKGSILHELSILGIDSGSIYKGIEEKLTYWHTYDDIEVDAVIGTSAQEEIALALEEVLEKEDPERLRIRSLRNKPTTGARRILTTGGWYGYLKIADGCNKGCSYCAIPSFRGPFRSVPEEELLAQARDLAAQGVRELILVAQETTLYGVDLYGEKRLPALLKKLCEIEGIEWIRILYAYPEEITDDLIRVIKEAHSFPAP